MSASILFSDSVAPRHYTLDNLNNEGLGGSEATLLRIAHGLAQVLPSVQVYIHEHNLLEPYLAERVVYIPGTELDSISPSWVIHQRKFNKHLVYSYPSAKHFLWLHDVCDDILTKSLPDFVFHHETTGRKLPLIFVSKWHRHSTFKLFESDLVEFHHIYNPIMPIWYELRPKIKNYDPNVLCYTSSPHKGLRTTLQVLDRVRRITKIDYKLLVANPGYVNLDGISDKFATYIGTPPHHELMQYVAKCMAHLFIQSGWPETFGLVYAEANALGLPSITLDIGAASEISKGVLLPEPKVYDSKAMDNLASMIAPVLSAWSKNGRPYIKPPNKFHLKKILKNWVDLIDS